MTNKGPGPGQVRRFAEEVQHWAPTSQRSKGIKAAAAWAMGDSKWNPVTGESGRLPDMKAIAATAKRAGTAPRNDSERTTEYCGGVQECLEWIAGTRAMPEESP